MSFKQLHKIWRKNFNQECLDRDGHKCVFCEKTINLNVHHITDRHELPNGGYVKSNGITVCEKHHWKCEQYHIKVECEDGYWPEDLYKMIGSSYEQAMEDSKNLNKD